MIELRCEEKFTMGTTYDYNKEIEVTLIESIPNWVKAQCSIKKIIRIVCNLTKMNPF